MGKAKEKVIQPARWTGPRDPYTVAVRIDGEPQKYVLTKSQMVTLLAIHAGQFNPQPVNRLAIAKATGISPVTTQNALTQILELGLINKAGVGDTAVFGLAHDIEVVK